MPTSFTSQTFQKLKDLICFLKLNQTKEHNFSNIGFVFPEHFLEIKKIDPNPEHHFRLITSEEGDPSIYFNLRK